MRTKRAKIYCALFAMEPTGVLATMYRNGYEEHMNWSDVVDALRQYRHNVRLNLADTLGKHLMRAIEWQNRKNGRAIVHRSHTKDINMTEAQERYHEAKTYTLEEWQERSYRGHKALAPMFKAHVCEYWGEQDNAYNHPYVREVMADCMY